MGSAIKILPHYTYEDYIQWEGQWELIEGIPYAMSPQPVPKHQRIAVNLSAEFRAALKKCKRCIAYQPIDYKISEETILQPDMLVVCKPINKKFLDFPPSLVVEILSPSTALKDRHTKFEIYQSQKIPYFIIISPDTEDAEIYELKNNEYTLAQSGHSFSYTFSFEDCIAGIDFNEIWQ
jgi:Uma2 family endonuclease